MILSQSDFDRYEVAFDLVKNPDDWKLPIKALIHEKDLDAVEGRWGLAAAILYYTGSIPTISPFDKDTYLVEAPGFYARYQ